MLVCYAHIHMPKFSQGEQVTGKQMNITLMYICTLNPYTVAIFLPAERIHVRKLKSSHLQRRCVLNFLLDLYSKTKQLLNKNRITI